MSAQAEKLIRILTGRFARNVYFWAWMVYMRWEYDYTPFKILLTGILFFLIAILFYTNNLLLLPRLISKRKYLAYFLSYTALAAIVATLYTGTLKYVLHFHPEIKVWMISPILASVETAELTVSAFLRETPFYFVWLFLFGLVFAMAWYVMKYGELVLKMEQISKEHLKSELAFLKNQINPHFLFNTLNNLYALTLTKSDKAPQVVEGLASIMRYFLQEANSETISVIREKEIMEAYIDVELLRLSSSEGIRFTIEFDKPCRIPPLLWVPVLENVFKHGTRFISNECDAEFIFTVKENLLHIHSKNTFKKKNESSEKREGIGLRNLQKRLQLLYPGRHQFFSGEEGHYFTTDVSIQLNGGH